VLLETAVTAGVNAYIVSEGFLCVRDCGLRVLGSVLLLVLFTSRLSQVKIKGPRQTSILSLIEAKTSYLKVCVVGSVSLSQNPDLLNQ
jgi:hypothetical protein